MPPIRLLPFLILPLLAACDAPPAPSSVAVAPRPLAGDGAITPIVPADSLDDDKVTLGKALFSDPRLSRNDTISCAHCHPLDRYGTDGLPTSFGIDGRQGTLNAPTVFNSSFNFRQFWDGRAPTLEAQVDGPLTHPDEMDSSWAQALPKLNRDPELLKLAQSAYGKALDADAVRDALATFQRSLTTPDSPFDRYLRGDEKAIDARAREGWRLFRELGCVSCHQGTNIGGNMYSRLGQFDDYFTLRPPKPSDLGRYNVTGREEDRFRFKVPSLRNVAQTAPYFHDGSIATLPEAVERIARSQLGLQLRPGETELIVAFLESLTAPLPESAR